MRLVPGLLPLPPQLIPRSRLLERTACQIVREAGANPLSIAQLPGAVQSSRIHDRLLGHLEFGLRGMQDAWRTVGCVRRRRRMKFVVALCRESFRVLALQRRRCHERRINLGNHQWVGNGILWLVRHMSHPICSSVDTTNEGATMRRSPCLQSYVHSKVSNKASVSSKAEVECWEEKRDVQKTARYVDIPLISYWYTRSKPRRLVRYFSFSPFTCLGFE
jgi:hypothetical protein